MRLIYFLFKQKTAYEMRISDWSSDVCASDLGGTGLGLLGDLLDRAVLVGGPDLGDLADGVADDETADHGDGEAPPLLDDLAVLEHEVGEGEHAGDGDERGGVRAAVQGLAQVVDARRAGRLHQDRKSTRLNSSH